MPELPWKSILVSGEVHEELAKIMTDMRFCFGNSATFDDAIRRLLEYAETT